MKRIILAFAVSAVTTGGLLPAGAAASGPAAPGKQLLEVECEGLGPATVTAPQPESSNGAAQVVGQKGHGIVVSSQKFVADFTTETFLKNEFLEVGGGQAHPNQATTSCLSFFQGTATEFFGSAGLPPGVGPDDLIVAGFNDQVIIKP